MARVRHSDLPRFASALVHATQPQRLPSIAAHGLLTEADLIESNRGRAYVHLVPSSPLGSWDEWCRVAKSPYDATAYVWVDPNVAKQQELYMAPSHAILSRAIHPSFILAMGIWVQGAGGGAVKVVYNREAHSRLRVDFVPALPGATTLAQRLDIKKDPIPTPIHDHDAGLQTGCLQCQMATEP